MLQHAGIEVSPADLDRTVEFFTILGFTEVPDPTDGAFTWLECAGTQIHLMHEPNPTNSTPPWPASKSTASRSNAAANTGTSPEPSPPPPAATESS
jgi:hypothetical protein